MIKKNITLIIIGFVLIFGILTTIKPQKKVNDHTVEDDIKNSVESFIDDLNRVGDSCYYMPFE